MPFFKKKKEDKSKRIHFVNLFEQYIHASIKNLDKLQETYYKQLLERIDEYTVQDLFDKLDFMIDINSNSKQELDYFGKAIEEDQDLKEDIKNKIFGAYKKINDEVYIRWHSKKHRLIIPERYQEKKEKELTSTPTDVDYIDLGDIGAPEEPTYAYLDIVGPEGEENKGGSKRTYKKRKTIRRNAIRRKTKTKRRTHIKHKKRTSLKNRRH
jgi:hypothetical protein